MSRSWVCQERDVLPAESADAWSLSDLDRALIERLQHDGRASVSQLARLVGVSEARVRPRLARLLESDAVRVAALVDPAALGRPVVAMLGIRCAADAEGEASVHGVATRLAALEEMNWIAESASTSTVQAQISVAENGELLDLVNASVRTVPGVGEVRATTLLRGSALGPRVSDNPSRPARPLEFLGHTRRGRPLDSADRVIVTALQNDGRMSFTRLAMLSGLSVAATRQRFLRLQRDGIVSVRALVEPELLGRAACASVEVVIVSDSANTAATIAEIPDVTYSLEVAGGYDLLVELWCSTDEVLEQRIGQILTVDGVVSCHVNRYSAIVKRQPQF